MDVVKMDVVAQNSGTNIDVDEILYSRQLCVFEWFSSF